MAMFSDETILLKKGMVLKKGDIKSEMFRIRLSGKNSRRFFALLQRAGIIEIHGKMIIVKRDFRMD